MDVVRVKWWYVHHYSKIKVMEYLLDIICQVIHLE